MILLPFEKIVNLPTGMGKSAEVQASYDLIDVMDRFKFQTMKAISTPYFRGLSGYLFDAQIQMGFDKDYQISDVEVRYPFTCLGDEGVVWRDRNLVCATLQDAQEIFRNADKATRTTDVGFDVPDLGASFFSSEFEGSFAVRLDAITLRLRREI